MREENIDDYVSVPNDRRFHESTVSKFWIINIKAFASF